MSQYKIISRHGKYAVYVRTPEIEIDCGCYTQVSDDYPSHELAMVELDAIRGMDFAIVEHPMEGKKS